MTTKGERSAAALAAMALLVSVATGCGEDREAGGNGEERADKPYAGLEERPIKALAPERVSDLLAGRGAGYALAAELNHYPGPAHALELASKLGVTAKQAEALRRIEARVHRRAKPLGRRLVALERKLDRAFARATITKAEVAALTGAIGELEGRVRRTHLDGHLETRKLLTRHQVMRYDQLRGYTQGGKGHQGNHGHGSSG